jgi:hypothetical protein
VLKGTIVMLLRIILCRQETRAQDFSTLEVVLTRQKRSSAIWAHDTCRPIILSTTIFIPNFCIFLEVGLVGIGRDSRGLAVKEEGRKLPQQKQSRGYCQLTREKAADARFPR